MKRYTHFLIWILVAVSWIPNSSLAQKKDNDAAKKEDNSNLPVKEAKDKISEGFYRFMDWLIRMFNGGEVTEEQAKEPEKSNKRYCADKKQLKVMLIGSDFIYRNYFHMTLRNYAAKVGYKLEVHSVARGNRNNLQIMKDKVDGRGNYDVIVMQEDPGTSEMKKKETVDAIGDIAKKYESSCQFVYFEAPTNLNEFMYPRQQNTFDILKQAMDKYGGIIAPVGQAFLRHKETYGDSSFRQLINVNWNAITYQGSSLAACVVATAITGNVFNFIGSVHGNSCMKVYE